MNLNINSYKLFLFLVHLKKIKQKSHIYKEDNRYKSSQMISKFKLITSSCFIHLDFNKNEMAHLLSQNMSALVLVAKVNFTLREGTEKLRRKR